ncbi:hypothetical protein D9758_009766 [Tetrapyrgos nigripes]|uniref:ATP-dependent DNA helicase n=1 Tax=Tetrapyrgos nigripes TaxID=182062 RepID=A0A8H5GK87_9AGAR|nr:hypothetical protein D9758_009766 [Tetrapyrgos nigripes]
MCLYDWVQLCERVKVSTKKDVCDSEDSDSDAGLESDNEHSTHEYPQGPKPVSKEKLARNVFPFVHGHPLADSHALKVVSDDKRLVPNFIGGTLPRADKGNREYYCTVMLTLFKPWRAGEKVKNKDQTWDNAFDSFQFTPQQKQILKNFQVCYECLDSRDDYNAQRRAMSENTQDSYLPEYDDGIDSDLLNTLADPLNGESGPFERRRQDEMNEMKQLLVDMGWTDTLHDRKSLIPSACHPQIDKSAHGWKLQINKMRQDILDKRHRSGADQNSNNKFRNPFPEQVEILDKTVFEQRTRQGHTQNLIDQIANEFQFQDNAEQERAFRIIANHAVSPCPEQLKMYIGGMGGTGKSTVLRALRKFFAERKESHRMLVVAPTGNAAALLAGSTYHYMFGINSKSEGENHSTSIPQICSRLEGVNYIFLDEVSMLSCKDMYKISAKLALALSMPHLPFGGMNMIFAGDFGQLPPAIGGESVALYSHSIGQSPKSRSDQENAIGQHLWHQVTTVVMLRKNMRQTETSENDDNYRKALENMRYRSCTSKDIAFLRTLISNPYEPARSLRNENFRNTPIILTYNKHKDVANKLGTEHFAAETGQTLMSFYSEDEQVVLEDIPENEKQHRKRRKSKRFKVNNKVQHELWTQPHSYNDRQIPGRLDICLGMPVMIRYNSATEICITKGQEGHVHGWKAKIGKHGKPVLDVLFIKLHNPPKPPSPIQFEGLPENVVPIVRNTVRIECKLSDDSQIAISRTQVEVLPNFAMTDFASQGKTRDWNVVDINNSRDFRAIYTALSRSSCADQTLILQGFNGSLLTGGLKNKGGYRQELRELEILDELSKLKHLGLLPPSVSGDRCSVLIKSFRTLKGQNFVPAFAHKSILWNDNDPLAETFDSRETWHIIDDKEDQQKKSTQPKGDFKPALGAATNVPSTSSLKRKSSSEKINQDVPLKRHKADSNTSTEFTPLLPFLSWSNNSCAYDSAIMLLHYLHSNYPEKFQTEASHFIQILSTELTSAFQSNVVDLARTRESLRLGLHHIDSNAFPYGEYADAGEVLLELTQSDMPFSKRTVVCNNEHVFKPWKDRKNMVLYTSTQAYHSTQEWLDNYIQPFGWKCQTCHTDLQTIVEFIRFPEFFLLYIPINVSTQIDKFVNLTVNQQQRPYHLRAVIYFGDGHFILRTFNDEGDYIYDGMKNGLPQKVGTPIGENDTIADYEGKKAATLLYIKYG